jgi:parallel beta-helix repeat protein
MKKGFSTYLVAKYRNNNLKWRVPSAMLAGIALLFPFQGFSRADDDHKGNAITTCSTIINEAGRYFLANDLKQCSKFGVSIAVSDVELDLRGHTIQGVGPSTNSALIDANGKTAGLSNIEIEGPGTLAGGGVGICFQNVHHSRVNNLVAAGNSFGIVVAGNSGDVGIICGVVTMTADLRRMQNIAATASTDNDFRDNVVAGQIIDGVTVIGANQNRFIHNNLSGNGVDGLHLSFPFPANNNIVRHNTADSNGRIGIDVYGSENIIDDNTALGNAQSDLQDLTSCTNTWTDNSFNFPNPFSCNP